MPNNAEQISDNGIDYWGENIVKKMNMYYNIFNVRFA